MWVYLLIVAAFLLDRLSKQWAASYLAQNGTTEVTAWLTLRETYNSGVAFGLWQGIGPLVGWLSVVVVVGMFVYLLQTPPRHRLQRAGMALIIGGALGNLVDRVTSGEVLDFFETTLRAGIFNVADIMINVGLLLVVMGLLWTAVRERQVGSAVSEETSAN